jgi:iron complex outermembrane receptor protein
MSFRSNLKRLTTLGVGAISFFLIVPSVQAQAVLEEIIVTAQKREENIQEVPISITNMSGDRLTARFSGGEDALALASAAPGLHVESSNGRSSPRFYLRGLGNADFTQAASQPVSIVFDEVPMEKVGFKAFPLFDMDRIEVIRGPQGTLFGRNTTAGIIKVDTRRPTDELEGYVKGNIGNYGTFNLEAAVGGPLIEDKLMARVSAITQNREDWVNNAFTGEGDAMGGHNIHAGRVQLLWTPTDNFSVLLLHQMQNSDSTASIFRANNQVDRYEPEAGLGPREPYDHLDHVVPGHLRPLCPRRHRRRIWLPVYLQRAVRAGQHPVQPLQFAVYR